MENPFLFNCAGITREGFFVHIYYIIDKEGVSRKRISFFTEDNSIYHKTPNTGYRPRDITFIKAEICQERSFSDTMIRRVRIIEEIAPGLEKANNVRFLPLLQIDSYSD